MTTVPVIVLADGTRIDTATGKQLDMPVPSVMPVAEIESPSLTTAHEAIGKQRRPINNTTRLSDLGTSPRMLTPVAAVLSLTMIGIADSEICMTLGIDPKALLRIRGLDLYDDCRTRMLGKLRQADQEKIRETLFNSAEKAAQTLDTLVTSGDDKIKLAAANSILDRTGHKAADIVLHKHSLDGEMRLRIIDDTDPNSSPTIDMTVPEGE